MCQFDRFLLDFAAGWQQQLCLFIAAIPGVRTGDSRWNEKWNYSSYFKTLATTFFSFNFTISNTNLIWNYTLTFRLPVIHPSTAYWGCMGSRETQTSHSSATNSSSSKGTVRFSQTRQDMISLVQGCQIYDLALENVKRGINCGLLTVFFLLTKTFPVAIHATPK